MKVFSVSQINRMIKDIIDNELILEDIMVSGELSSFSVTRNIAYFTLKDNDNLLNCIMFGVRSEFSVGDLVQCRGNIKYYPKGGKLSFNVFTIEKSGQGELYKKFLELKAKLEQEGLFDAQHKVQIPQYISSIGVVTSKTGAVLQDIRNVTSRRNPNLDIYVYDAQVQGKYAVEQVIEGISYFDNFSDVDVIVVARGGGSLEDLMPFNDETLCRVAYACNKPLISAVGHETDFSILDFVADLRAPTPSAAAELVTFDAQELRAGITNLISNIEDKVSSMFSDASARVNISTLNIEKEINNLANENYLYIQDLLNGYDRCIDDLYNTTKYKVDMLLNTLDKRNPATILKTGYAIVTKDDRQLIDKEVKVGDEVKIETSSLLLSANITKKEKRNVRK